MPDIEYYRTAELPDLQMWLRDGRKQLVDLSTYTLVFKVGFAGSAAIFTKSSGVTGAAGSGDEPTGTPNTTVTFTAGELDSVTVNQTYRWQVKATLSGKDRYWQGNIKFLDIVT